MQNSDPPQYYGKELEAMSFAVNYHQWIIGEFEHCLGETVAEVGAGIGSVSRLLLERPIRRLFAFEPSQNMYPMLKQHLRSDKRATTINDFFRPASAIEGLDSIVYINVLEHIEDDQAELASAFAALRPMGHVLLFVPALAWLYSDLDKKLGHFRRYTKNDLRRIVSKAGFSVVKTRYFDVAGIIPWYVNFVLLRNSMATGSVVLYDKLVVPIMRRTERVLPLPLGKNVLLIGQKL